MNYFFVFSLSFILSYIIGSIPTSFIIAKILKGIDIRNVGSGNVGATNVYRSVGKKPGFIVLIIDILKGVFVVTVVADSFHHFLPDFDNGLFRIFLGLAVICGHIWSVFLKFSGGKGVATTIGVMGAIAPGVLVPSLIVWLIVFFITNYVSLASIAMGIAFPVWAAIFNQPFHMIIFAVILCGLNTYKHKDNINRLLKGEENKTVIFKPS